MAFCSNCGKELTEGAKFCALCGARVSATDETADGQRKNIYDGQLYKCPNCGDILDAYESTCETCGWERRGNRANDSVQELSRKLQEIEAQRPPRKIESTWIGFLHQGRLSQTDKRKVDLIKNFAIPNSKEDILEFAVLAVSNIDPDAFNTLDIHSINDVSRKAISSAWMAKFEQAYQKGKIMFGESEELQSVYQIYTQKKKSIRKKKSGIWVALGAFVGSLIALILVINLIVGAVDHNKKTQETERLQNLVTQVEEALANGNYKLALMYADSIRYTVSEDPVEVQQWGIQREYWMDKVIAAAADHGVQLEKPELPTEPEAPEETVPPTTRDIFSDNMEELYKHVGLFIDQLDRLNDIWNDDIGDSGDTGKAEAPSDTAYKTVDAGNFTFRLPGYWREEGSKSEYLQYYADALGDVVMLSIAYPYETDESYEVSFEGLYRDNENMISSIEGLFTGGKVIKHETFESSSGVKGILYQFTCKQNLGWFAEVDCGGYCFCFPSEEDHRWFYVYFMQTNNFIGDDYKDDYIELISTIKKQA